MSYLFVQDVRILLVNNMSDLEGEAHLLSPIRSFIWDNLFFESIVFPTKVGS